MEHRIKKFVAAGLLALSLLFPCSLKAREGWGATILITQKDGQSFEGELIAVKPNALIILKKYCLDGDVSVDLAAISSIRIVKNSKAATGALIGFLAGYVGGLIWGLTGADEGEGNGLLLSGYYGLMLGGLGGTIGFGAGAAAGLDENISFAGQSEQARKNLLVRLNRLARMPSAQVLPQQDFLTAGEAKLSEAPERRPRLKLSWSPAVHLRESRSSSFNEPTSFRFVENLPPGEAGPFSAETWLSRQYPRLVFSRISAAYELTRNWSTELELHLSEQARLRESSYLTFTSSLDGIAYWADYYDLWETSAATSVLGGIAFRPLPPAFLQPHVFELSVAAGPAWIRSHIDGSYGSDQNRKLLARKMTWTFRARAGYEFHFIPALSMGAFVECRRLKADIPAWVYKESLTFHSADYANKQFTRMTEVSLPRIDIDLGGVACGLKINFQF